MPRVRLCALALLSLGLALPAQAAGPFILSSPDLKASGKIPLKHVFNSFGCKGDNKSPALAWKNPPAGTQSFALTVYDPDAPTGSGWWHWIVVNIPNNINKLDQGASSADPAPGLQTRTDYGTPGYGGPCPPVGDRAHRYIFTLHALKVPKLEVDEHASGAMVGFMIHSNSIGKASFTAMYGR